MLGVRSGQQENAQVAMAIETQQDWLYQSSYTSWSVWLRKVLVARQRAFNCSSGQIKVLKAALGVFAPRQ